MIKEFETSVVTSLQSITFPFVNVDDEAIFPIRWNDPISYHVIGKVSDQPCTSITRQPIGLLELIMFFEYRSLDILLHMHAYH